MKKEPKEQSIAYELTKESLKTSRNAILSLIIIAVLWCVSICVVIFMFTKYISNIESETITTTQTVKDIDSIDNSNLINGDVYGNDNTN